MNQEQMKAKMKAISRAAFAKKLKELSRHEFWTVLAYTLVALGADEWSKQQNARGEKRQAHYFSAEFLLGRSLLNNIINMGLDDEVRSLVQDYGFDLAELESEEIDPGLGNGGLGRLAACFLDSCSNLNLPVTGHGIMYRYGLFRQEIKDGFQKEFPDAWRELPYPFTVRREGEKVLVRYNDLDVWAVPFDLPVTAFHSTYTNTLRLWKAEPYEEFNFNLFNSQRFDDAVIERNRVNDIYRVLYPNDTSYDGKVLRVRQQYFFVSAALQSILKEFKKHHGTAFDRFSDFHVIQLNDTHPVLAIPELMRLLMDEEGLDFDQAWEICKKTFAYTNHTTLAEALEKWDLSIFQFLFPRILEIIQQIDARFRQEAKARGLMVNQIEYLAPIHDGKVHMAWMAAYCCFSINGVAALHTEILKADTLRDFYRLYPERFNSKTNGVTPRRWLRLCNPELASYLTELTGSESWVTHLQELTKLSDLGEKDEVQKRVLDIKRQKKVELAQYLKQRNNIEVNPDTIFDVQCKRLHEYKRQLLNAFAILDQYYRIKDGSLKLDDVVPVTYFFAGKAAPGYFRAKAIIKFINEIAKKVNNDPELQGKITVVFIPNYNVSVGEKLFPAADISEQISTVGKEASGTGNMKFMMNGAMTLGTWDGANLEIVDAVGEENAFMFGVKYADFPATFDYYNSQWQYSHIPGLKRVVDSLITGEFHDGDTGMFDDLYHSLLHGSSWEKADVFYVLGDFADFCKRREEAHAAYKDRANWAKMAWQNITKSGRFSSDRTIRDYADEIWKI